MAYHRKVIVQAAITGSVHTPSMSPHLPITPKEIADETVRACNAGAATVHLHARDPETGAPSSALDLYREILVDVKSRCDVVCGITSGGGARMTREERASPIREFKPELASFNPGSFNLAIYHLGRRYEHFEFDWEKEYIYSTEDYVFRNTFKDLRFFAQVMEECGTKPEIEVFDLGMINNIAVIIKEGYLKPPVYLQLILGMLGGQPATVDVMAFIRQQASVTLGEFVWSVCAASREQYALLTAGLAMGGNIRVGLEDSLYLSPGVLAKSNAEQVEKVVRIVRELGYEIASPQEAREMLGLKGLSNVGF